MGEPRAQCIVVAEEVWALAKADYLGGMTGPEVARKHGLGLPGLRGRAAREGWSKKRHAEAHAPSAAEAARIAQTEAAVSAAEPPLDPEGLRRAALARAAGLLLSGRPDDAQAVIEGLEPVLALAEDCHTMTLEEVLERSRSVRLHLQAATRDLAEHLLGDGEVFPRDARWAFAWRAEHLGPEAEARDRAYAVRMGWTDWLYNADGRLTPDPDEEGGLLRAR